MFLSRKKSVGQGPGAGQREVVVRLEGHMGEYELFLSARLLTLTIPSGWPHPGEETEA